MKENILYILLVFLMNTASSGQHSISVTGGGTFSTLYKVGSEEAFEAIEPHKELFDFSLFSAPSLNLKYEYTYHSFRFSTGFSFLTLGARDYFWKGTEYAYMYLTVPLLFGYKAKVSNKISLVMEGGTEIGTSLTNVGSVVRLSRMGQTRPYLGLILGIEVCYKRVSLGVRFHLGLNDFSEEPFRNGQAPLYLRHVGGTVYLGYTFWDSAKAKKRRAERKSRKL